MPVRAPANGNTNMYHPMVLPYSRAPTSRMPGYPITEKAEEKVAKREAAEVVAEKARLKLEKVKALLEEAKSLVTVYVVG